MLCRAKFIVRRDRDAANPPRRDPLRPNPRPHIVVFVWDGFAPSGFWGVAYDDSDEIMLPPSRRSAQWKKRAASTQFACGFGVKPLWDHYDFYSSPCE
jgi:hypothetical protein